MAHTKKFTVEIKVNKDDWDYPVESNILYKVITGELPPFKNIHDVTVTDYGLEFSALASSDPGISESQETLIKHNIEKLKGQMYSMGKCWGVLLSNALESNDYTLANELESFIDRVKGLIEKIEANG